ncbi:DUF1735 domain-containing protein [uncultured Muribaculum sp.]|uniref:BT_3987 domain-containing protein n=1 Tax=uncultured Muribaculum sp. TaxID=1918613 RepID=UPI0025ECCF8E|nr:DUF1735 domain-containing protein [uncultured Muribaculum sp.]
MKPYKFFSIIGALALTAGFTSCSDDDEVYTPGFEGIEGQVVLAPTVNESYKFIKIPTGDVKTPNLVWSVAPRSRVRAGEELKMKFLIDNSLIDEYNSLNSTDYVALPDGIATLVNDEPSIAVGNTSSEVPVTIQLTDDKQLLSGLSTDKTYLLPVRLAGVIQGSARIAVSSSNISYVTFNVSEEMLNANGNPTGTIVPVADRAGWSGTPGDGAEEWKGDNAWNNPIMETGSYNFGNYPTGSTVTINLGKEYSFDGIYSYPYYGQSVYAIFRPDTEILIGSDGESWTSLGKMSRYQTTIAFYAPVTAQYIKFILGPGEQTATTAFSIYAL